ncbi:zinc ABC transporter substrate-binding protein [Sulfurovum sp. zt1-1]|uniref:Zinc ABC transporter substrate-binding protein n=1 Tax=Sulfurovum zhangzhouensis TaxID=3019067 RepID=A0ABT7QZR1_9BACT|nr:zinc ABC transporter substrate-binding protein [Sulfurovum zhangzhouensis]MDM5271731.1 zinc ABC transporter substrate-binding protein [Sulfurovum zhangzhouensis]
MKKLLLFILVSTYLSANIKTVVSILPEKTFVEAIGGEKVDIALMVMPGNSPHTYEPKPSQMKEITKADIYFKIGVEFEHVWLEKFSNLNAGMKIVDLSESIEKLPMLAHDHHDEHDMHEDDEHEDHDSLDPHIWTDPKNVLIIANNIYNALSKEDPENASYYKKNLEVFTTHVKQTDESIKKILINTPEHAAFMVFHPAWGYFAKAYGLEELPVEVEGKAPKPQELMHLIEEAKQNKVKAIFTQPEFSDATAKLISEELGIKVIKVSPLAPDWSQNLINLANAIAGK